MTRLATRLWLLAVVFCLALASTALAAAPRHMSVRSGADVLHPTTILPPPFESPGEPSVKAPAKQLTRSDSPTRMHVNERAGQNNFGSATNAIPFPSTVAPASPTNPNYTSGHFTDNTAATTEGGEAITCDEDGAAGPLPAVQMAKTLWWRVVADGFRINLRAKGADTIMSVYTTNNASGSRVTPLGAPADAKCDDDANGAADRTSQFVVPASSESGPANGTVLFIQVGVWDCNVGGAGCDGVGQSGLIHLSVEPPGNDDSGSPFAIPTQSGDFTEPFSSAATLENENGVAAEPADEPEACGSAPFGKTVWASYTASATGTVVFEIGGTSERSVNPPLDTVLVAYAGDGAFIDCNDDITPGSDPGSAVSVSVSSGSTYFIQMGGYDDVSDSPDSGLLNLSVRYTPPPPPPDSDGDGVPDSSDSCPSQAGSQSNGCPPPPPDGDGDGTPDSSDGCPSVAGPTSNGGCPIPPPPDSDGDGTPNATDRCPTVAGPASNGGCPTTTPLKNLRGVDAKLGIRGTRTGVRVTKLTVFAPSRTRIEVSCTRGCSRQVLRSALRAFAAKTINVTRIRGKVLRKGTKIEIRVTKTGYMGQYRAFLVKRGTASALPDKCLRPGSRRPITCP